VAWGYVQTADGVGFEWYERLSAQLGDRRPDGLLVHVAGEHDGNLRVIEVWQSEDDYRRFREERLVPALTKLMGPDAVSSRWPPPGLEPMDVRRVGWASD
jgi:hypothetical protein